MSSTFVLLEWIGLSVGIGSDRINFRAEKIFWICNLFSRSDLFFFLFGNVLQNHVTSEIPDYAAALTSSMGLSWLLVHISLLVLRLAAVFQRRGRFGSGLSWKYFSFHPLMPMQISLQTDWPIIAFRKQSWQNMLLNKGIHCHFSVLPGLSCHWSFSAADQPGQPSHCRDPLLFPSLFSPSILWKKCWTSLADAKSFWTCPPCFL